MRFHLSFDQDDLSELKSLIDTALQPLVTSIHAMTQIIDTLVTSDNAQSAALANVLAAVGNLITLANTLKADLTAAIANSGMTAADQAALQAIIDKHTTDSAAIAASAQKIADALVVDQPGN